MRIVIQGYPGAYHEIAARLFYKDDIEIVPSDTFEELVSKVEKNEVAEAGIMAIENSIAGSLMYNYNLINHSSVQIVGEVYLRIKQNLLTLPGVKIAELTEVHSHHMAIAQCKQFFKGYPHIKLVESVDTAQSAQMISTHQNRHIGALASDLAAEIYGLQILRKSIETNKRNYTRFVVIDHFMDAPNDLDFNKVSLSFAVSHEAGSLYRALGVLYENNINMTKIQSTPIPGRPFEYLFFVDFIIDDNTKFGTILHALSMNSKGLKILGKYQAGQHYEH